MRAYAIVTTFGIEFDSRLVRILIPSLLCYRNYLSAGPGLEHSHTYV